MSWTTGLAVFFWAMAALDAQIIKTHFSCKGRSSGYYADMETGCQVYHMCDGLGRQFTYTCPNATLFQQRMLICDHWYMVNCSKSEGDYAANLRIGQREKPFVDDSESNPYQRTPRPDLLSHPGGSDYNSIYRSGRARIGDSLNVVGAESDLENQAGSTDEPLYFLPSHWSTEYSQYSSTTSKTSINNNEDKPVVFTDKRIVLSVPKFKGKPLVPSPAATESPILNKFPFNPTPEPHRDTDSNSNLVPQPPNLVNDSLSSANVQGSAIKVNFRSGFKATTPVYPLSVEPTSPEPGELGVLPPRNDQTNEIDTSFSQSNNKYKGTTPVYPTSVEPTSPEPGDLGILPPANSKNGENVEDNHIVVSFNQADNKYKGTTPVYPLSVEATSPEPSILGILPPYSPQKSSENSDVPSLTLGFLPPKIDVNFKPRPEQVVPQKPSQFYQPPNFEPDYTQQNQESQEGAQTKRGGFKVLNSDEWENLRKKFLIPDYEFPLDSVSRPSYDSVLSSFQVDPLSLGKK